MTFNNVVFYSKCLIIIVQEVPYRCYVRVLSCSSDCPAVFTAYFRSNAVRQSAASTRQQSAYEASKLLNKSLEQLLI